jgi:F-box and WD-40 domain protein MET30
MLPPSTPSSTAYDCDTLPAARLASEHPSPSQSDHLPLPVVDLPSPDPVGVDEIERALSIEEKAGDKEPAQNSASFPETAKARKLCVRHQRMADEGTNLKLQEVTAFNCFHILKRGLTGCFFFFEVSRCHTSYRT